MLRSTTLTLRSTTALARSKTSAQGPDDTSAGGEAFDEPLLEEVEGGESGAVTTLEWESVKDPPLNLRVAISASSGTEAIFLVSALAGRVTICDSPRRAEGYWEKGLGVEGGRERVRVGVCVCMRVCMCVRACVCVGV